MIALLREASAALTGLGKLMAFREDWRTHFDVSADGVWRSFGAVILSIPGYVLFVFAANYLVASLPGTPEGAGFNAIEATLTYLRIWFVFPFVAAAVAMLLGLKHHFAGWLVLHNWAVFALLHMSVIFYLLYAAGIADTNALATLLQFYLFVRIFVHWRVACAGLQTGIVTGAAAAAIPMLVDAVLIYVL